jgi:hypothetical protein
MSNAAKIQAHVNSIKDVPRDEARVEAIRVALDEVRDAFPHLSPKEQMQAAAERVPGATYADLRVALTLNVIDCLMAEDAVDQERREIKLQREVLRDLKRRHPEITVDTPLRDYIPEIVAMARAKGLHAWATSLENGTATFLRRVS